MKLLARAVVLLVVAIVVGWMVDKAVLRRAPAQGMYQPQVLLGAATAGLFAAGAAATLVGIGMALSSKKS